MTPAQCRAARALADISQETLADLAKVGVSTVRDFEIGKRQPRAPNIEAMRLAIEKLGIRILDDGEVSRSGGEGVRFE